MAQDSFFGLHPNMAPLEWAYNSGELAAVHAVGMEVPNRSHFLAMEEVEDAHPTSSERRGWVNRMIGLDDDAAPSEAVHLTVDRAHHACRPAPTVSANRLKGITLAGGTSKDIWATRRRSQLAARSSPARSRTGRFQVSSGAQLRAARRHEVTMGSSSARSPVLISN